MIGEAQDFLGASDRAVEPVPNSDGPYESFPGPALVLSAIGIEIAFKALIGRTRNFQTYAQILDIGARKDLHNLQFLFGELSKVDQEQTRALWTKNWPKKWMWYFGGASEAQQLNARNAAASKDFDALLAIHSESFVTWRHIFEPAAFIGAPVFPKGLLEAALACAPRESQATGPS